MAQKMYRREFLKMLAATATLLEGPVALGAGRRKAERPNILVMLSDDMGWGQPGFQGGTTVPTPNLDRIAQEGVQLTQFYVQAVCSPTRFSSMCHSTQCTALTRRRKNSWQNMMARTLLKMPSLSAWIWPLAASSRRWTSTALQTIP